MRCCAFGVLLLVVLASGRVEAADNWSGAYIGVNAGGGWSDVDWHNRTSRPAATFFDYVPGQGFSDGVDGVLGGAQIGVAFQRGPWVLGIEAMLNGADISGRSNSNTGAADDQFKFKLDTLFVATARVGYAWDNWLAYGKAGYAAARIKVSVSDSTAPTTGSGSDSQWHSGAAAGIGFEYRITPQLSLGAEYVHVWLESGTYQLGGAAGNYSWDVDVGGLNLIMARMNYRFASF